MTLECLFVMGLYMPLLFYSDQSIPSPERDQVTIYDSEPEIQPQEQQTIFGSNPRVEHRGEDLEGYDIEHCSEEAGSSGRGDLSECEDAERETEQEQENQETVDELLDEIREGDNEEPEPDDPQTAWDENCRGICLH